MQQFGTRENKYQEPSVNTKGYQFYSDKESGIISTMITGYWNGFVTIKAHPPLPESKREEGKIYDYDNFIKMTLVPEKLLLLLKGLMLKVLPEVEKGNYDFQPTGITSGSGTLMVTNGEKLLGKKECVVMTMYSNQDADGVTDIFLPMVFSGNKLIVAYDNTTGATEEESLPAPSDLYMFINFLNEAVKASTNAIAHSIRNQDKYTTRKAEASLKALCEKFEINTSSNGGGNYNSKAFNQSSWMNGNKNNNKPNDDGYDYSYDTETQSGDRFGLDEE